MNIQGTVAFVTGANGGIGRALITELLRRGAAKVYAAGRSHEQLAQLVAEGGGKVVPVLLDLTDPAQIEAAVRTASDVRLLVNNAGVCEMTGVLSEGADAAARREMEVNYFAPLALSRAFLPVLKQADEAAVINILSFLSLVTMPKMGTYSASKSAALALTRSLRAELADQSIAVVASMPVQVDTAMGAWSSDAKVAPAEVAVETLDALAEGLDDVFPGEPTKGPAAMFASDPKGLQAYISTVLP
ncbi:SDR family NAD(P)-dependent oxidoreductase [Sphingomonas sp. 22176]|uniref:SDR family NAD(P)-dependent oxidoreductase n=1 Tax=Sphingomonas sp. 22176 TaxID=3453884 RepID=UPI003F870FFA